MVEEAVLREEKSKKQSNERKVLIGVLSALALAIVGLVVGIIVANVQNKKPLEFYEDEIAEKLSNLGPNDIREGIAIYQEYIDILDSEDQAELYTMRAIWVSGMDANNEYGAQVVDDVLAADSILQTINSAVNVANSAYNYEENELGDEYSDIVLERQEAAGIDMNEIMEAEG